jgi:hypothetical protein
MVRGLPLTRRVHPEGWFRSSAATGFVGAARPPWGALFGSMTTTGWRFAPIVNDLPEPVP